MTGIDTAAGGPRPRRRRGSITTLVVVLVVVSTGVGVFLLRGARQEPSFAAGRTSLTGVELIRVLGDAVAREGSGRLELTNGESTNVQPVDFEVHGENVDFVLDAGGGIRVVARNGVVVGADTRPVNIGGPRPSGASPMEMEAIPLLVARLMKVVTFQETGTADVQWLSPGTVYTRTGTADDGSTVWTGSWTVPGQDRRNDVRLVVDEDGLPVELGVTLIEAPGSQGTASVSTVRYSGWGRTVRIPEPTPFSGPQPELDLKSSTSTPSLPSFPSPSP